MVQQVVTNLRDDLNPEEQATRTVRFGFDGVQYEIDLSDQHYQEMKERFYAYTIAGREIKAAVKKRRRTSPARSAEIRAFAREQGLQCAVRGRIPDAVIQKFEAAQS